MNPSPAKYKRLRGAVQSFTDGFTSILCSSFADLASYSSRSRITAFEIDFISQSVDPRPDEDTLCGFFTYRDLHKWFDDIGCSFQRVRVMTMKIIFELDSQELHDYDTSTEQGMRFQATSTIEDDRGKSYHYDDTGYVFFDYERKK